MRRSLIGSVAAAFPTFAGLTDRELFGILLGLTVVYGILAFVVFRVCESKARERGLIDVVTNY